LSTFQAQRIHDAIAALDGSEESNAALDFVLASVPWHEVEIIFDESDAVHDATVIALSKFEGTCH
jgi:hypothetical protein